MVNTVSKREENEILETNRIANSLRTKGFQVVGESDVRLSFAFSRGKKSNSRSVRWMEKKGSEWNSRWTKWTREEHAFPALKRLLSVTPSSPFFPFYSPPRAPTFFVNVYLPGHNYNWRNVGYLLINRRLSLIFCCSRTESGIKNPGEDGTKEEESERKQIRNGEKIKSYDLTKSGN